MTVVVDEGLTGGTKVECPRGGRETLRGEGYGVGEGVDYLFNSREEPGKVGKGEGIGFFWRNWIECSAHRERSLERSREEAGGEGVGLGLRVRREDFFFLAFVSFRSLRLRTLHSASS